MSDSKKKVIRQTYNPEAIESRWQSVWEERQAFRTPDMDELGTRPKFYALDMFPYPSGAGLHVGHPVGYTATDVVARARRMQGYNVLHPMGWDAFGLPAERAAVREGRHPSEITQRNIVVFKRQIRRLGLAYDWQREISTATPDYYRWTQWIFLRLHEQGLAYLEEMPVHWCPALGTVLANEEVQDGRYVETGDPVIEKPMRQWMLRITAYADRLRDGLEGLDWPEGIKKRQRDWIENLHDWLFSRQRYWGEPFPLIHTDDGDVVPVPEAELPVTLPEIHRAAGDIVDESGDVRPALSRAAADWQRVQLPDGRWGTREMNTMPQWAGSCWYYLRFLDPTNDEAPFSAAAEKYWMPVDLYVGGAEHAVLHLLYARFWHKVLYDCGLVQTEEPFQRLYNQGMVHKESYRDDAGKYYAVADVEKRNGSYYNGSERLTAKIEKMSKSKLNVVNPDDVVDRWGADALRLYTLFAGPVDQARVWPEDAKGVEGCYRFLERVWRLAVDEWTGERAAKVVDEPAMAAPDLNKSLHQTIRQVTESVESLAFNTAIARMMVFVNDATAAAVLPAEILKAFIPVLAPFAPHIGEELWERTDGAGLVAHAPWPAFDEALCVEQEVTVALQVNGKKRGEMRVPAAMDAAAFEAHVLASEMAQEVLDGRETRRVVTVPGRLVNFVV